MNSVKYKYFIKHYVPDSLTNKDKLKQIKMLIKSKKKYKKKIYNTRKNIHSFTSKPSNHIINAKKLYNITKIIPTKELAKKNRLFCKSIKNNCK